MMKKLLLFVAENRRNIFCAVAIVAFVGVLYLFALNGRYHIPVSADFIVYDKWNERLFIYSNKPDQVRYDKVDLTGDGRKGISRDVAKIKAKQEEEELHTSVSENEWWQEVDSAAAEVVEAVESEW